MGASTGKGVLDQALTVTSSVQQLQYSKALCRGRLHSLLSLTGHHSEPRVSVPLSRIRQVCYEFGHILMFSTLGI